MWTTEDSEKVKEGEKEREKERERERERRREQRSSAAPHIKLSLSTFTAGKRAACQAELGIWSLRFFDKSQKIPVRPKWL